MQVLKYCDSCCQEKPFNPDAPIRTKARGFYDWYCWDCHKQGKRRRFHATVEIQSTEFQALQNRQAELLTELNAIALRMKELIAQNKQSMRATTTQLTRTLQSKKKRTTTKKESIVQVGPTYAEAVAELQTALAAVPRDTRSLEASILQASLEHKLQIAQCKLAKYGPDAYDYRAEKEEEED